MEKILRKGRLAACVLVLVVVSSGMVFASDVVVKEGNLDVNDVNVGGNLDVANDVNVCGDLKVTGTLTADGFTTAGTGTFGDLVVDTDLITVNTVLDRVGIAGAALNNTLEVNGTVNLNNGATTQAGDLNRGYFVYKNGVVSYGMKLQYDGSEWGTMLFGPNQANRFISLGKCGTALEDDDMVEYMRMDLDNGNVSIYEKLAIGTTAAPTVALDVTGAINATGGFTTDGVYSGVNAAVNTTAPIIGIDIEQTKTAGVTDAADYLCGGILEACMNDADSTVGWVDGVRSKSRIDAGNIGDAGNFRNMIGACNYADGRGGKVWGNVIGTYTDVFLIANMDGITGNIYGHKISVITEENPVGLAYGLYIQTLPGVDYAIYTHGGAPVSFSGEAYFDGDVIIDGDLTYEDTDPKTLSFYPITQQRAIQGVKYGIPPDKWGGATFYFDKDRGHLVLYDQSSGKFYKLKMEEIDDVGVIESEAIYENKFRFDRKTGEVVATQRPKSRYKIKDGYEFDRDTGKFYEMVEQDEGETATIVRGNEVSKEQAVELRAK